jgi:uncharacterized membrane protein
MTWGVSDFLGGLTSRRADELLVAALSQVAGVLVLALVLPLTTGVVSPEALLWGALAGLGGAGGLVAYFRALAIGPMGVTAPVAALVGAGVPVTAGLLLGERPGALAYLGIAVGLLATVLVTRQTADPDGPTASDLATADPTRLRRGVLWAALGGGLFGCFFVGLDMTPADSGLWPLLGARAGGLTLLVGLLALRRPALPARSVARVALGSGVLDMAANTLFLLAVREGLLVLVSVLTSLYPVGIVLLARGVLKERLGRTQWMGVGLALAASALIAA